MMPNIQNILNTFINQNPRIANNPNAQEIIQVLQSGDAEKGKEIAKNLCNSYGVTEEQAIEQARKFFNF
jgi:hypothetical protein